MKIYFTASIAGKAHYAQHYQSVIDSLKSFGCAVSADHIMDHTEAQIRLETRDDRLAFHKKLTGWIKEADCMVAEVSFPSISVGYEISLALQMHKPVLILYTEGDPPSLLNSDNYNDRLVCEQYSIDSIREVVEGFLDYIRGKTESRFTFYVTSDIMAHLDRVVRDRKIPKAVYLRKLIEADMNT